MINFQTFWEKIQEGLFASVVLSGYTSRNGHLNDADKRAVVQQSILFARELIACLPLSTEEIEAEIRMRKQEKEGKL